MKKITPLFIFAAFSLLSHQVMGQYSYTTETGSSTNFVDNEGLPVGSAYNYEVLLTGSMFIDLDKDYTDIKTLPFTVDFFGTTVTGFRAFASGYITFNTLDSDNISMNTDIPTTSGPNNAIYAMWDSFDFYAVDILDGGILVFYETKLEYYMIGSAPNRTHVIRWVDPVHTSDASLGSYFAILLHEGGTIEIVHEYLNNNLSDNFSGTIGIENLDGTIAYKAITSPDSPFPYNTSSPPSAGFKVHKFTPSSPSSGLSENYLSSLQLYPNPSNNHFTLDASKLDKKLSGNITIYDVLGNVLLAKKVNTNLTEVNTTDIPSGVYFAKFVDDNNEETTFKIMVNH